MRYDLVLPGLVVPAVHRSVSRLRQHGDGTSLPPPSSKGNETNLRHTRNEAQTILWSNGCCSLGPQAFLGYSGANGPMTRPADLNYLTDIS